ncbi:MAG: hypothetical protein SH859_09335 [Hyphomicrobium aestuarii]|nr:hypothetical protein [Hyphomicrobium aestuarii]
MAQILVRELDDAVKERLLDRAKRNGRTLEAEARAVLEEAASAYAKAVEMPSFGLGTELAERSANTGLTQQDWEEFDRSLIENRATSLARNSIFSWTGLFRLSAMFSSSTAMRQNGPAKFMPVGKPPG